MDDLVARSIPKDQAAQTYQDWLDRTLETGSCNNVDIVIYTKQ